MDSGVDTFGRRLQLQLFVESTDRNAPRVEAIQSAARLVKDYHSGDYTGPAFDTYGVNDPNRITSDDLIAMAMLSIAVREGSTSSLRPTSILLLGSQENRIADLLNAIPSDRELQTLAESEFDRWLGPGSPGDSLYWLLRKDICIPRVAVYKLLARKRPMLMPIRDTVVEKALKQTAPAWWSPWWKALSGDPYLVRYLADVRAAVDRPDLSLLRVADIIIWLRNRKPHNSSPKLPASTVK